jgi:hypothetical protein
MPFALSPSHHHKFIDRWDFKHSQSWVVCFTMFYPHGMTLWLNHQPQTQSNPGGGSPRMSGICPGSSTLCDEFSPLKDEEMAVKYGCLVAVKCVFTGIFQACLVRCWKGVRVNGCFLWVFYGCHGCLRGVFFVSYVRFKWIQPDRWSGATPRLIFVERCGSRFVKDSPLETYVVGQVNHPFSDVARYQKVSWVSSISH